MSDQTDLTVYEGKLEEAALSIADYVSDDAKAHVLTTKEDYAEAADIINQLKSVDKALETMEKAATSGALKTVAWIRDRFRPHRQQVKEGRQIWDDKLKAYLAVVDAQQDKIRATLQLAVLAGNTKVVQAQIAKLDDAPAAEGIQLRKIWRWKVINRDIVPTQFTSVDKDLVDAEMKKQLAHGDSKPYVAGIEFYQDTSIAAVGK